MTTRLCPIPSLIPSRVSGRGYKIGPVSLSVRLLALSRLNRVTYQTIIWYAMCEMSVLEGLLAKNTDKEGVAGGRVNAQAFSF